MSQVFICYANQDRTIAETICARLEASGIPCWIAPRDVAAGKNWDKAITEAISQSRIMVLVFSVSSNDSDYCINEVGIGFDKKQEIIPFFIDDTTPHGGMELYLRRKQWLNAQKPPLEPHLVKLVDEVKGYLAQIAAREEAAAKEKARREAEAARAHQEAEARKKAAEAAAGQKQAAAEEEERQEAARIKKESEEAARAREAALKARKEAEEALKEKERREAEAAKARRDAEAAVKEKELREAEVARARKETEAADKARKAVEKARQEAEAAVREKELLEAAAAKARQDAEAAVKEKELREAEVARARRDIEEARRASEAAVKARREAEAAGLALKGKRPAGKAGSGWLWSGAFLVFVGLFIAFFLGLFSSKMQGPDQWPNHPISPLYPQWAFMLLFSLPFLIPGLFFIRHWASRYDTGEPTGAQRSAFWWLLPILLTVVGGIAAWLGNRKVNWRQARNMLTTGILMTLIVPAIMLALAKPPTAKVQNPPSENPNAATSGTNEPLASISGWVLKSDNSSPVPGIHVYIMDTQTDEKKTDVQTDSSGYFSLSRLAPGSYIIGTFDPGSPPTFQDIWYNGVTDKKDASTITVKAYDKVSNIKFSLPLKSTASPAATPQATKPASTTVPPASPNEYLNIQLNPTSFDKTDIKDGEVFTAHITGNITSLRDIPFDVSGVAITPQVIARNVDTDAEVMLACANNITLDNVPVKTGAIAAFQEDLPLNFGQDAATGAYQIVMKMKSAKVNIGLWVDVSDYFNLANELSLGWIKYSAPSPTYSYIKGYVYDAIGYVLIPNAVVTLSYSPAVGGKTVRATTVTDTSGFYELEFESNDYPCELMVTATGYSTQWYNNATEPQATLIIIKPDETLNISFLLRKSSTSS